MKYMNSFDNFVMVLEFDEYRCSSINLMNISVRRSIYVLLIIDALYLIPKY